MQNNILNIPKPRLLDDGETVLLYVIVGEDAFPLKENLMKSYHFRGLSYAKRTFNNILSRSRRIVENPFGILEYCFRVFLSPIQFSAENC